MAAMAVFDCRSSVTFFPDWPHAPHSMWPLLLKRYKNVPIKNVKSHANSGQTAHVTAPLKCLKIRRGRSRSPENILNRFTVSYHICMIAIIPPELSARPRLMFMITSSNGNIIHVAGPLWGESTGDRWIPFKKTSDAELCCLFCMGLNKWLVKLWRRRWFEAPCRLYWRHCNVHRIDGVNDELLLQPN